MRAEILRDVFEYIEKNMDRFVEELFVLLRQPSISAQWIGVEECAALLATTLERLGARARILPMGGRRNPPLVYGEIVHPANSTTVLIYGHYDVQPPEPLDEWDSPPFEPTLRNGRIYCRGSADNKGQFFCHFKAIEALLRCRGKLPVNVKFLLDPEEEVGSPSLMGFVGAHRELFAADLAFYSDGPMDASGRPRLSFGNRGVLSLEVNARGANRDLHSGNFGGPVPNPAWRLVELLSTLRRADGTVLIDGFYDKVVPATPEELQMMAELPFDEAKVLNDLGLTRFAPPDDVSYYEKIMFRPTLNICGISSGYAGEGSKTVLPSKARLKVDMRLVIAQDPEDIFEKFVQHARRNGFEELDITLLNYYHPSRTPVTHPMAAKFQEAIRVGLGDEPVLVPSSGGSFPGAAIRNVLNLPMLNVPYGNPDENNHAPNENLTLDCFLKGIRTSAALLARLATD